MYVDGFVIPVPKRNLAAFVAMARKADKVWMDYGALAVFECLGDDVPHGKRTSFPRSVKVKRGETVVFSWILFKSKTDRDRINKLVMADKRISAMMEKMKGKPPFDSKRMIFGGFKVGGRYER